jgi:hypothetical protein
LAFAFIGFTTLFAGGKAAGLSCPGGLTSGTPDASYGYTAGEAADGFAGAVVASFYGGGNGWNDTRNGSRIDQAKYYLQSYVPNAPFGTQYNISGHAQSDRIFSVDSGNNTTGRTSSRWFGTGGATGDQLYANAGDGGYTCPGWDAIGPGRVFTNITPSGVINYEEAGNRHALDCGESYYAPGNPNPLGKTPTQFWISQIPHPNGESGHWQVQVFGASNNGYINIDNIDANPMGPGGNVFTVNNGATVKINLIWHADYNPPPTYVDGVCTKLVVTNGGLYHNAGGDHPTRQHVTAGNLSVGRINGDVQNPRGTGIDGYAPDENGGDGTKTWYFFPSGSNDVDITITQQWYKNSDPNKGWHDVDGSTQHIHKDCFSATCQVMSITGDGPSGSVLAYGNIYVWVRMQNTSADSLPMINPPIIVSDGSVMTSSANVPAGGIHDFYATLRAPGWSPNPYSLSFHPEYNASAENMSYCGTGYTMGPIPVYQYFQIQPRANITAMDKENPTTVTYTSGGQLLTGPSFPVTTFSSLTKTGVGCPNAVDSHVTSDTYGNYDHTYVFNNPCINAGDTFCAHTLIAPASGWHGPNGYPDINDANAQADSACLKTVNEPYAHFQGSDVSAGGGFGRSCTATQSGSISTYSNATGPAPGGAGTGGSGAQFGAEAASIISGLTSASLRANAPTALSGLTFANNDGHIGGGIPARTNGGYMGGTSNFCMPDYFGDKPPSLSTPSGATAATAGAGAAQQYYKPVGNTLTLNSGTIANGFNQVIFVEGNVTITGNIQYDAAARGSIKDIPSFYLVVKNGNIHVNPGVTRLDGVYVAQPDTTSPTTIAKTGIINTCWSAADTDPNHIYNNCKRQLTVNGGFVANKVLLTRSYSSLRYSQNGEHNLGGYAAHNCGNVGYDVSVLGPASAPDCAAEIFNFNPELYMSQPGLVPSYGAASGKYDAITSLSPVL